MLDLTALAAEVAAVLNLDADVLSAKRTVYEGEYRINLYRNCLHVFRAGFGPHDNWNLHVLVGTDQRGQTIEEGYRIEYEGQAHPEALAVLSTVYAHVNGQGGEAARDVWPHIDPEWVDIGVGAFACECGERVGGIIDAGETATCECGRVYRLVVRVEVSEPVSEEGV